jgi:hypothetical protein
MADGADPRAFAPRRGVDRGQFPRRAEGPRQPDDAGRARQAHSRPGSLAHRDGIEGLGVPTWPGLRRRRLGAEARVIQQELNRAGPTTRSAAWA